MPPFDVSASIMCGRLGELADDLHELEMAGVDSIHVDIMDGHFVPNLTFGPDIVRTISSSTRLPIHAHMMVTKPEAFVGKMADAGAAAYLFHIEAAPFPLRLIEQVTQAGMVPGIAINPSTPLSFLRDVEAPIVLLMSVEPGFAGQRWVPSTAMRLERVRALLSRDVVVGVDGNVTPENVALAAKRGATLFVCGTSSLFTTDHDYADAVASIRAAAAVSATGTPVG